MVKKEEIFPIGIGTWKIDPENFDADLKALVHSYEMGQNYLSLYMLYNGGSVVRQMRKFVDIVGRENLFINANLEPTIEKQDDIESQLNEYLKILGVDYVDSFQLHSPFFTSLPLIDAYREIRRLVGMGKVHYIGISNANMEQLSRIEKEVKVDFFEGVYNLECKIYEDNGVIDYCHEHGKSFVAYQPLRRNRTAMRNYPVLVELAEKYHKTQNQVLLNWIIKEKKLFTLIKSTNMERIDENVGALDFEMDRTDYAKLNFFRSKEFDDIQVGWDGTGVTIDQLANQFD